MFERDTNKKYLVFFHQSDANLVSSTFFVVVVLAKLHEAIFGEIIETSTSVQKIHLHSKNKIKVTFTHFT